MKKEVGFNKLQIKEYIPASKTTGEGPKDADNELQVWDDSLKTLESTRQVIRDNASPIRGMLIRQKLCVYLVVSSLETGP
ncbi:hypothetical protein V6N11_032823 [Hibiscus sabdariffa]|uniref:Uncharacterized protein n=1 Tax=Hibiscus sabdariffa TaxID=183260 RepID=A0ABR2T2C2_9ROSI